jgi:hypothetical protein
MTTDKGANNVQSTADDRDSRIRRTPEKVKAWSYAADRIEHLLIKFRSELADSRVADDFDPEVVHDLHTIQSRVNRIKEEIRWIEMRLEETMVIEREWWKK